ncbi:MAG: hypothetical protein OXG68_02290 [Chloroflexi bacterium]|nr:hypothetical protein [Chloroflexota bacterium]
MTDPDLQAAHEEAIRQLAIKFEGETHRLLQKAVDEYDRAMNRTMKIYAIVILVLLIVIAIHISQMPPSSTLPT